MDQGILIPAWIQSFRIVLHCRIAYITRYSCSDGGRMQLDVYLQHIHCIHPNLVDIRLDLMISHLGCRLRIHPLIERIGWMTGRTALSWPGWSGDGVKTSLQMIQPWEYSEKCLILREENVILWEFTRSCVALSCVCRGNLWRRLSHSTDALISGIIELLWRKHWYNHWHANFFHRDHHYEQSQSHWRWAIFSIRVILDWSNRS